MKKGFTLAESLISASIVAVLATVMMAALNNSRPNREMIMFKKAYYLTERIVADLVNDEDYYPEADLEGGEQNQFFRNTVEAVGRDGTVSGNTKFCNLFAMNLNRSTEINCASGLSFANGAAPGNGTLRTSDGMVWIIPVTDFSSNNGESVIVDTNGDKKPNCEYNVGSCDEPDRFSIHVFWDGRVAATDAKSLEYLNNSNIK